MTESADIELLGNCLEDERAPIAKRMRSCFLLKHIGSSEAVDALARGMKSSSVLLKHEIMYVMGQMGLAHANKVLEGVLRNEEEDPVVRHEAAEALAAIGSLDSMGVIDEFRNSAVREVAETCEIAFERLQWLQNSQSKKKGDDSGYVSVDPAPAESAKSVAELEAILLGDGSLFKRYKAMFALRNIGTNEAVESLVKGFNDASAVFRHEIAFVLGQMQNQYAIPMLTEVLLRENEHEMVRHEAAEALGAMADNETVQMLEKFKQCENRIVGESCDVALDIHDYWTQ